MKRHSDIWLADLLEVVRKLGIEDVDTLRHVSGMLGVGLADVRKEAAGPVIDDEGLSAPSLSVEAQTFGMAGLDRPQVESPSVISPRELDPVSSAEWAGEPEWNDADLLASASDAASSIPHQSLLSPKGVRPILSAMLATDGPGGDIDIDAIIDQVAAGKPISVVPYQTRPSLCRGVRVLVDLGTAMQVFHRDQLETIVTLNELVGGDIVQVEWFEDDPGLGCGAGSASSWGEFVPPDVGVPVLVLGDLGIGSNDPAIFDAWLRIADTLQRRDSRLIALVPYPEERWPGVLVSSIDMVMWDRGTSIADVTFRLRR